MENLKNLEKIAKIFQPQNIITSDEIDQVLKGIVEILATYKKGTDSINEDTKQVVNILLEKVAENNRQTLDKAEVVLDGRVSELETLLKEVKQLIDDVEVIASNVKDGKDADEEKIVEDVIGRIKIDPTVVTVSAEEIKNKLSSLEGDNKLDISAVKGFDLYSKKVDLEYAIKTLQHQTSTLINRGGVKTIIAGTNIIVDNTDPNNPIISSTTTPTFTAPVIINEAVGSSALTLTGATQTSSFPVLDVTQAWNNAGTTFTGIRSNITNTASNAASLLADLQVGGTSKFKIDINGSTTLSNQLYFNSGVGTGAIYVPGTGASNFIGFTTNTVAVSTSTIDTYLRRGNSAATIQLGSADAAAPVAQNLSVQSVVAGTTNTAGTAFTIKGSQGTGTGAGGSLIFEVAPAGLTGSSQNPLATALTIASTKNASFAGDVSVTGSFTAGNGNSFAVTTGFHAVLWNGAQFGWASAGAVTTSSTPDTILTRRAAATLNLGAADAASPVAQTLSTQGSRAGTDTNVGGANLTIQSGIGTGTGTASSIIFKAPVAVGSGSTTQTATTKLTITGTAVSVDNLTEGYTTTATAAGTTTLDITAKYTNVFTGTSTQTVKLPTTSVLQGTSYSISNQSTGSVTVQSSGANTIVILGAGMSALFTAQVATPTTAANWSYDLSEYMGLNKATTMTSNAVTIDLAYKNNTVTNNSAATMAITLPTAGAIDGEMRTVRVLDFSAATQTIGWTNTENSTDVSVPTTSNGSTTLPYTVGFQYNSATSKWRCIAKCA